MLLAPAADVALSNERALAFLDAKFASLDVASGSLNDTAAELLHQHEELQRELDESSAELDIFVRDSLEKAHALLAAAKETALARYVLTDDITALKEELVSVASQESLGEPSTTLLEDLDALHEKLGQLEQARTYVRIVERGVQLSEAAIDEFKSHTGSGSFANSSLQGYLALQEFVTAVSDACGTTESSSASSNLEVVAFLFGLRSRTWREIKNVLSIHLLAAAENIKWPMKVDYQSYPPAERKDFENTFTNLLRLQEFGKRVIETSSNEDADEKPGLYPLQVLVQPIAARFKFHFEGTRPTNRLDKPEWYFTHILNAIHEHKAFLEAYIQPLIVASSFKTINATHEFTYLLLPILSRKLKRTVPSLLPHSSLLAHTIYQTLVFDGSLRDEGFGLENTSGAQEGVKRKQAGHTSSWEGLSEVILGRQDWFAAWLDGEKKFADGVFLDISSSSDAWQFVDEGYDKREHDDVELRPTTSARRIRALMEQITDRYQHLPHFPHRLQFLLTIQLPILTSYHSRISSSLDAYENLSSSLMRAVPGALAGQAGHGVDRARLTSGVEGLTRLFKASVSAQWIKEAMEGWGEDLVFLELWAAINEKPALRERVGAHPSLPSTSSWSSAQGTLFDELIKQYSVLVERADEMMVRQIYSEVETDLKTWITTFWNEEEERDDTALPAALLKPITSLSSSLAFLARSLPTAPLTTAYKRIASHLAGHMHQRLIYHRSKGRFSAAAGAQFKTQVGIWVDSCRRALMGGAKGPRVRRPEAGWTKLQDVAALLTIGEAEIGGVADALFDGKAEEEYTRLSEQLELNGVLSLDEARDVLRARNEVRR